LTEGQLAQAQEVVDSASMVRSARADYLTAERRQA
jgi:hypothetical protein